MRMAERSPWGGGTGPYYEPEPDTPTPAGSLAEEYADPAKRAALGAEIVAELRRDLEPGARRMLDHALEGRGGGAAAQAADAWLKGKVAVAFYLAGAAPHTLRDALREAWVRAHYSVIEATAPYGPGCLADMFRAAAFPLPAEWGDTVVIYHGNRGVSVAEAQADHSWTDSYDTACFWAERYLPMQGVKGEPLVLRREVPRHAVLAYIPDANEAEVVLDAEPGGELAGTPSDWAEGAARWLRGEVPGELYRWARFVNRAKAMGW
jgi:hypothetical protein